MDVSKKSIKLTNLQKSKSKNKNFFLEGKIGDKTLHQKVDIDFDLAVFNPPLSIEGESKMIHRDGGDLGIEIPLLFLEFARTHLKPHGEAWFIAGDPKTNSSFKLLEILKRDRSWKILDYHIIEEFFNQGLSGKHQYKEKKVDYVNLVRIKLQKIS